MIVQENDVFLMYQCTFIGSEVLYNNMVIKITQTYNVLFSES